MQWWRRTDRTDDQACHLEALSSELAEEKASTDKLQTIRRTRKLLASDLTTIISNKFSRSEIEKALDEVRGSTTSGKVLLTIP
jgi:hypothetical protein